MLNIHKILLDFLDLAKDFAQNIQKKVQKRIQNTKCGGANKQVNTKQKQNLTM